jgi:hypothetical protein
MFAPQWNAFGIKYLEETRRNGKEVDKIRREFVETLTKLYESKTREKE